ncbi:MAG: OmpP1/FadL family transporter, partial [Pirellulaceae bacterium]
MTTHFLSRIHAALLTGLLIGCLTLPHAAFGQSYGVELHNTMTPASGGMGGASIAEPQDLLSAINGNPAAMTQFRGTQFSFGGGWAEANYDLTHTGNNDLPGITPFSSASGTPGTALGNIGVTQDMTVLGLPVTTGVGLITTAGLGVDYAAVPESNNTALTLQILQFQPAIGVRLTDRLSAGASFGLHTSTFDGLFVGSSKATPAYGARGQFGVNFRVNRRTHIGGYYQTKARFI